MAPVARAYPRQKGARSKMGAFHRGILYPLTLFALGEGKLLSRLREIKRLQFDPPASLRAGQESDLARILAHALERVPYYRGLMPRDHGADGPFERLSRLPLLAKETVQRERPRLQATPLPARYAVKTTGGSTGEPVTVLKDRAAAACERAAMWLGYSWRGICIGDRAARFWGIPLSRRAGVLGRLGDLAMNRIRFSAFAFDEEDLGRYWDRCRRFRPAYFHGYVSMLEAVARYLEDKGIDARGVPSKAIVATSEVLSPQQRALLERVFGVPILIEYGCGELGPIAYDCEEGMLHTMDFDLVVEVLRPDGKPATEGESGEVVLTDLRNRAMPLLRYRVGDFAERGGPCPCGRGLGTLRRIWGREYDFVTSPGGRRFHGEFFMYIFEELRRRGLSIGQFQVVQKAADRLKVHLVAAPETAAGVQRPLRELLGAEFEGVQIELETVPSIPRRSSGKMAVIVRQIPSE